MLIFRGYYSYVKARAGTFSTEEYAICSRHRKDSHRLRSGCQPGRCASVVRGETDWQMHGQRWGCYHWGALKLRLLPKPMGLRRLTDSPARSERPADSRISFSDISLLVAQLGCTLLKPLSLSLESCIIWFLNEECVKNKLGSLARSQSNLPFR